jgi:hypothetical protein
VPVDLPFFFGLELVLPPSEITTPIVEKSITPIPSQNFEMTEDEERELAELLDD